VRKELWRESALDLASFEDGKLAQACMMVVSHRHSQYVLDHTFAGNYTGSRACIPNDTSLLAVILQALLFFLPGWVVSVKRPTSGTHATMTARDTTAAAAAEWDPDLRGLVDDHTSETVGSSCSSRAAAVFDKGTRLFTFYSIPKVKFALALSSHIGYVLLLCLVLVIETETGSQSGHGGLSKNIMWANWMRHQAELSADLNALEVLLWVWTFSRLLGELHEIPWDKVAKDGLGEGLRLYIRDNWNKLDLTNSALVFTVMGMRLYTIYGPTDSEGYSEIGNLAETFGPRVRLGYALVVVLTFTRTLQFLRYFESIGVLIIILGFMVTDVISFFAFIVVFSFGFGVAFAVLLPGASYTQPAYHVLDGSPLWQPFWGLFGDFDLEAMEETTPFSAGDINFAAPVLLWVYMFLTTIMLINLLIAQMSDTYARVSDEGTERWQFQRAQLILEYKDNKTPVPQPLNILWEATYVPYLLISQLRRACGWRVSPMSVQPGFKLVPDQDKQGEIERAEGEALKRALAARRVRESSEIDAKVAVVGAQVKKLEDSNNARFEALQGSIDKVLKEIKETIKDTSWQTRKAPLPPTTH
jgi:hypothetical protein